MNKLFLYILIGIIFSFNVLAINIQPTSIETNVYKGVDSAYPISITNTYTLPITQIYTENLTYVRIQNLTSPILPNTTVSIYALVNAQSIIDQTFTGKLSFIFIDNITRSPQTFSYSFSNNSYPQINIKQGDSITFTNVDSVPRTLTSTDFDYTLQPQQTQTINFPTIKNLSFYDKFSSSGNVIAIISASSPQNIFRPEDSQIISFHIKSQDIATVLQITPYEQNFTINFWESKSSAIRVKNMGNVSASNINLDGKWLSFSEAGFTLDAGQEKTIAYSLSPRLNATSETNQTYIIPITAKGSNSASLTNPNIYITIPYATMNLSASDLADSFEKWSQLFSLCLTNPENILCQKLNNTAKIEYRWKETNVNISEKTILDINDNQAKTEADLSNINSKLGYNFDNITTTLSTMANDVADLKNNRAEDRQSIDNLNTSVIVLISIIVCTGIGYGIFIFISSKKDTERNVR